MAFPQFDPSKLKILFFSRGRGRGHAIPDIEIIRALERIEPDAEVRIVSYGAGAATFDEFGFPLIDLGLPETSPIAEMSVLAGKLIGGLRPHLVVSHEEFAAAPAAKIFDVPVTFIIDFFDDPELYSMNTLKFADEILFTGFDRVFTAPEELESRIRYVGPVLRQFTYSRADRKRARQELGIDESAFVLSMFPGSWPESRAASLDLVLEAFDKIEYENKMILWLAGNDVALVQDGIGERNARVIDRDWNMDRLMVASDVALTKMNRMTVYELQHLSIPTVSLSWSLNRIDDQAVRAFDGVLCLEAAKTTSAELAEAIEEVSKQQGSGRTMPGASAEACANYIASALRRTAK